MLFFSFSGFTQTEKEWIRFDGAKYIKIGVKEEGIYKVNLQEIKNAGLDLSEANKENLQLFHRGTEVPILEITDSHLLFYGKKNDGASDSLLYRPYSARVNKHFSLFSDNSYYFLTLGKTKGKRATVLDVTENASSYTNAIWHWETQLNTYFQEHTFSPTSSESPSLRHSFLTIGETFSDKVLKGLEAKQYVIPVSDIYRESTQSPRIELLINGRRNGNSSASVSIGAKKRALKTVNFNGFEGKILKESILLSDLPTDTLNLHFTSTNSASIYSLTYSKLEYPQKIKFKNLGLQHFKLPITDKTGYKLELDNVAKPFAMVLDISAESQPKIIKHLLKDNKLSANIPVQKNTSINLAISTEYKEVLSLASCQFNDFVPSDYNYIIITNSRLKPSAEQYAAYRKSSAGGQYKPLIADIIDIYNQFNYGEPSPVAIRNFISHMVSDKNWKKHLVLIGHSISLPLRIQRELVGVYDGNKEYENMDQIPTIGYPGSDLLLVDGLNENKTENLPGIPVGRISATDNSQVIAYLQKVKEYENVNSQNASWQKNILHISGGKSTSEIQSLRNSLNDLEPIAKNGIVGANPIPLVKKTLLPVEKLDISKLVNDGVGMLTYFGHGSATSTDYDFGYASAVQNNFRNANKYLFMYFNGCGVGNIFSGRYSTNLSQIDRVALSTDWLFSENKGAIAILANSWDSYISTSSQYLRSLYPILFNNTQNLSIGEIQLQAAAKIVRESPSEYEIANLHQTVLQGDPALRIFSLPALDYTISQQEGIYLKSVENGKTIAESNKLNIEVILQNTGRNEGDQKVPVDIILTYSNNLIEKNTIEVAKIANKDTLQYIIDNNNGPITRIEIKIDSENKIVESDKTNNNASLNVDWETASQKSTYSSSDFIDKISPSIKVLTNNQLLVNGGKVNKDPEFEIIVSDNQPLTLDKENFDIYIKKCSSCDFQRITDFSNENFKQLSTQSIQYTIGLNDLEAGTYQIMITAQDISGNLSNPYHISFTVTNEDNSPIEIIAYPNPATQYIYLQVSTEKFNGDPIEEIEFSIYNSKGDLITNHVITDINTVKTGWYWSPVTSGVFIYKIHCRSNTSTKTQSGRIIVH